MAETTFPPAAAIPQADINRTGPGWDTGNLADRADVTSHLPLGGMLPPGTVGTLVVAEPAPPPEPPTEAELRTKLADAIETKVKAEAAMQQANDAHEHALRHEQRCSKAVARYATLAVEIDEFTLDQLRTTGRGELSDELRERVQQRSIAEAEHAAAKNATAALLRERAEATRTLQRAEVALTGATWSMLGVAKQRLQEPLEAARKRVAAIEQVVDAGPGFALWKPVVAALMDDPMTADLDVIVGDEPLPPPPVPIRAPIGPVMVRLAKPIDAPDDWQDIELPIDVAHRLQQRTQAQPTNTAIEEFRAVERAQRQARGL